MEELKGLTQLHTPDRSVGEMLALKVMAEAEDRKWMEMGLHRIPFLDSRMMITEHFMARGRWTPTSRFLEGA